MDFISCITVIQNCLNLSIGILFHRLHALHRTPGIKELIFLLFLFHGDLNQLDLHCIQQKKGANQKYTRLTAFLKYMNYKFAHCIAF